MPFYSRSIEDVLHELKTSPQGLSSAEAATRLAQYGPNVLPKKKKDSLIKIFFRQFCDPVILLLIVAAVVTFFCHEYSDVVIIIATIVINACIGTYQENKANKTADALHGLVETTVTAIRDGEKTTVKVEDLTIGDYILLESGNKISADLRIVSTQNLMVNESILTGESTNIEKTAHVIHERNINIGDQRNMAFSGTTVVSGRAEAVVVRIGHDTELGKIADTLAITKSEKSPLTLRMEKFSRQISVAVIIMALTIAYVMFVQGVEPRTVLISVIAFAVSALPEGLPLALTMALTIASTKMAKENVIVRKLKSAESLGSCTVIASDKTGTLTVNEQTAKIILLPDGSTYEVGGTGYERHGEVTSSTGSDLGRIEDLVLYGAINNEASIKGHKHTGDSIDIAFLILAEKVPVQTDDIQILNVIPYESENKYSAVFYEKAGRCYCTVKGSLEVVHKFCGDKADGHHLAGQNHHLAASGYRVIALANGEVERKPAEDYAHHDIKNLDFAGMVGFIDPIRKEVVGSVAGCHRAGIKVVMVTGDHPLTALSIAKQLGIAKDENDIASNVEVDEAFKQGKHHFDSFVAKKTVFARVAPLQKFEIVESLKRHGQFVAVTGDGANDAPALKAANIGVAMGSGTDIAREASDMIILDDNFTSIVSGIKEGRIAYANIRKVVLLLISTGLAEAIFFFLSIMLGLEAPLVAVQFLWLNVITNSLQDFSLSFEKAEGDVLAEPPRKTKESIFNRALVGKIVFSGVFIGLLTTAAWWYLRKVILPGEENLTLARTYVMCLMVFVQNIHTFNCRSERRSVFRTPIRDNPMTVICVISAIILQIIVLHVPIFNSLLHTAPVDTLHVVILFAMATSVLFVMEIYKIIERLDTKKHKR